ncbi:MAG: ABC transporter permease [Bacteroidales bacterium]|nr:ABC transporter permease [Bacteroidales bacterium]
MVSRLLRKNTSTARIIGFVISNFIGLAIVLGGVQFYTDAASIWNDSDSFIRSDFLVINKKVTSENTLHGVSPFSAEEQADIAAQPWVRQAAPFTASNYQVRASVDQGGRGMSTSMFFEAIPDDYVDVPGSQWQWREGDAEIPLIISKDYLTLYNFGFASAAGLPQMSEGLMSGIPLRLTLTDHSGSRTLNFYGRIAGYSNRLNTILVPQNFMDYTNSMLASGQGSRPSRMIVEVNSPGDVAISKYMETHDYEIAGDKSATSASFLLKVVVGIVLSIGIVITILSLLILMLSISLIMEKNRDKLHSLLMLGYTPGAVASPYRRIVVSASAIALLMAVGATLLLRHSYSDALAGLGAGQGSVWPAILIGCALTIITMTLNLITVHRRVLGSWRITR